MVAWSVKALVFHTVNSSPELAVDLIPSSMVYQSFRDRNILSIFLTVMARARSGATKQLARKMGLWEPPHTHYSSQYGAERGKRRRKKITLWNSQEVCPTDNEWHSNESNNPTFNILVSTTFPPTLPSARVLFWVVKPHFKIWGKRDAAFFNTTQK